MPRHSLPGRGNDVRGAETTRKPLGAAAKKHQTRLPARASVRDVEHHAIRLLQGKQVISRLAREAEPVGHIPLEVARGLDLEKHRQVWGRRSLGGG